MASKRYQLGTYLIISVLIMGAMILIEHSYSMSNSIDDLPLKTDDRSELSADDFPETNSFSGFVENVGQNSNSEVEYYFMSYDSYIAFGSSTIYVGKQLYQTNQWTEDELIRINFDNSNQVSPTGVLKNSVTHSYYVGSGDFPHVSSYGEVWYYDLYDKIDLRYYNSLNNIKYEFVVHPGGNPDDISIHVNDDTTLIVEDNAVTITPKGIVDKPVFAEKDLFIYQGDQNKISGRFRYQTHSSYGFQIESYDHSLDLIIDPLVISQSTYINGNDDDAHQKIDYSATGYYIAMRTLSTDFPTQSGAYDPTSNGFEDIVLMDVSYNGEVLLITYFGGSSTEHLTNIASGVGSYVCIVGWTSSTDFPTTFDAFDQTLGGSQDGFLACFGFISSLSYSTYIGGGGLDSVNDVALSYYENTNITVSGYTYSSDFPTTSGVYSESRSGPRDAFAMKFMDEALLWSTYFGGTSEESSSGVGMDITGNVYLGGWTDSSDLPLSNQFQSSYAGGTYDMFVLGLDTEGTSLLYSSYYGGISLDNVYDGHVDPDGNLYLTGSASASLPTSANAFQTSMAGVSDGFAAKISPTGALSTSTYLGGTGIEYSHAIFVGNLANSDIFIAGETGSTDFPITTGAYQTSLRGTADAFYARISSDGTTLVNSTYFGGSAYDAAHGIYGATIVGTTTSSDLPLERPYAKTKASSGIYDSFMTTFRYVEVDTTPPSVNSPADISYVVGTTGNDIYWSISDEHPDDVYFEIDGVHVTEGVISEYMTWSNGIIVFSVDGLSWGDHTATIIVDDAAGNEARDTVNINVYEVNDPTINSPADISYDEGTTGNTITWTVGDAHPDTYSYTIDTVPQPAGSWSGTSVQLNVDGLDRGVHTLVLSIQDVDGNSASDTVLITVNDVTDPLIDSPADITYSEDSTGNSIAWSVLELYPDYYEVYIDDKLELTENWMFALIEINVDNLSYGTHNVTIVIYDDSGNSASDQVDVTVEDITNPDLDAPPDISYDEGSTGNTITWTFGDRHPSHYFLYLDEIEIHSSTWDSNGTFTWNVDGLSVGTYEYGFAVYDQDGNINSNSIFVTVIDALAPNLNSPEDITIIEGSTGNSITWDLSDKNPDVYNITLDGMLVQSDTIWNNGTISFDIDYLTWGQYKFTIYVFDTDGNMNFDEVNVTVTENIIPDLLPLEDIFIELGTNGNLLSWIVGDVHPGTYQILVEGVVMQEGSWNNGSIQYNVDDLTWGNHTIVISIFDLDGNIATDTVKVQVYETIVPDINSPNDMEIDEGTGILSWVVGDQHPDTYVLYLDDIVESSGSWINGTIDFDMSGLAIGTYIVKLVIYDIDGNTAEDMVTITVVHQTSTTGSTTTTSTTQSVGSTTTDPLTTTSSIESTDGGNGAGVSPLDFNWTALFFTIPIFVVLRKRKN